MGKSYQFWIYVLQCDNNAYYTGYTDDLMRRYAEHRMGSVKSKYTRSFRVRRIAACWRLNGDRGSAMKVESLIKKMDRSMKEKLVRDPGSLVEIAREDLGVTSLETVDPAVIEGEYELRGRGPGAGGCK